MRTRVGLVALVLALAPWGCTRVGTRPGSPPEPVPPEPAAPTPGPTQFGGRAHLGGKQVEMVLELTPLDPPNQAAVLRIPDLSLEARGQGAWKERSIRLELRYGDACPGTIQMQLDVDEGGNQATGTLSASDCTGSDTGPVSLLRRGAAPPRPQTPPAAQPGTGQAPRAAPAIVLP